LRQIVLKSEQSAKHLHFDFAKIILRFPFKQQFNLNVGKPSSDEEDQQQHKNDQKKNQPHHLPSLGSLGKMTGEYTILSNKFLNRPAFLKKFRPLSC
jgi:hypothetical protein